MSKNSSTKKQNNKYSNIQIRMLIASWIMLVFAITIQIFSNFSNYSTHNTIKAKQFHYLHTNITLKKFWHSFKRFSTFSDSVYIVAWWDVMLSRNIWYYAKKEWYDRIFKEWNYNPISEFENCKKDNCMLFLNLESLFSTNDHDIQYWWFDFRSNPKNIETLLQYKWNRKLLLALPNNHFSNWWLLWLKTTKELLNQNWINYVWAWETQEESRSIFSWNQWWIKFCINAYSYDWWSATSQWWRVFWNSIKEESIKSDLELMKWMNCDVKIISLHRWAEYRFSPNNQQKNLAHNLIDFWADLILWWHSHIPGEFEQYNWKYIFYSLWNFIFDQWRWMNEKWGWFDYFYDEDLNRKTVPTYISMLLWLKFTKNINQTINIELDKIDFSSTKIWIFSKISDKTKENLLDILNKQVS